MSVWPAGARAPIGVVGTRLWDQGPDPVIVEAQERGRAYGRRLAELHAQAGKLALEPDADDVAAATGVDVETVRRVLTHVFRDSR